jgi:RNA polymerase sigma-B factor
MPGFEPDPAAPDPAEARSAVAELQQLLLTTEDITGFLDELTALAVKVLPGEVSCGITLRRDRGAFTVASSDSRAGQVDEIQYGHDEGPCLRSLATGQAVVVEDLADDGRWGSYRMPALGHGVRSSLSLPLRAGSQVIGALNIYATTPRAFGPSEQLVAGRFADEASRALELAVRMAERSEMSAHLQAALASRAVIDQAVGIIMGQNRCTADEAFEVLRTASHNRNVKLRDIATDMVTSVSGPHRHPTLLLTRGPTHLRDLWSDHPTGQTGGIESRASAGRRSFSCGPAARPSDQTCPRRPISVPANHARIASEVGTAVPPAEVAAAAGLPGAVTVLKQACSEQRQPAYRNGYEYLAPLFVEHAALPEGHPHRERLRDELIAGYLPVARHIARRFRNRGEPPQDLEQVASMGLVLAVDRFDPQREVDFLSFAVPTITGEVLRYLRDRTHTIRMPRRLRDLRSRIYDAADELAQHHSRAARPSEIARHLELDVEIVLEGLAAEGTARTSSLDEPGWSDDGGSGAGDRNRFAAALSQAEPEFDLVEHREGLAPLLAALPERERRILLLRFFGGLTQTEIATQVGLSQMHVSRLLTRTLTRLRHQLATD